MSQDCALDRMVQGVQGALMVYMIRRTSVDDLRARET